VIDKAADVIGGLPADHIRSFMQGRRMIVQGDLAMRHRTTPFDRIAIVAVVLSAAIAVPSSAVAASVTSALINKQLDSVQNLDFDTTLPDAMQQIGNQTGVSLEADPAVWDLLPWGDQTTITAKIRNKTLRQALSDITQKLALEYVLTDEAVEIHPMPALKRLGKRATVDELAVLALMAAHPVNLPTDHPTVHELLEAVDRRLVDLKSPFAVDNRTADSVADQKIAVARNASIAQAMEDMTEQVNAAWYPWGKTILVVPKEEQIRMQLGKTINTRFNDVDVAQVLLELSQKAGVDFSTDPGAYQRIPAQYRKVQLLLDNSTIQQALDSIAGYTGLGFEVTEKGVHVSNQVTLPGDPTTRGAPK
jgi:hypothetical protein